MIEPTDRVLQLAKADGCGSHNERAIFDGFSDGLELFGFGKQWRCANGGTSFAKSEFIRVHDTKMEEAEIAHGAGSRTDIQGIARSD